MHILRNKLQAPVRYATGDDFAGVLENDLGRLYLLAFLLTANHADAERCVAAAMADDAEKRTVLKEWARSWIKSSLIRIAIRRVGPAAGRRGETRDPWLAEQAGDAMHPVTLLEPFERFVFVMVMLEGYSMGECAVLLNCAVERVAQARVEALRQLPLLSRPFGRSEAPPPARVAGVPGVSFA